MESEYRGQPHQSTTDPSDPHPVVSVRLYTETEKRVDTMHVHEDGTAQTRTGHI